MPAILTSSSFQYHVGVPQSNGVFFDGTRYWVFYADNDATYGDCLKCKYGTSLSSLSDTDTNAGGTPAFIAGINNSAKAYSIVFGQISSTWYAWALVNQSDSITGKAFALFRWELSSSGLASRINTTPAISDKATGHVCLSHDYGGSVVTNIYGAVQEWNATAASRANNAALSADTGMGSIDSTAIDFPEHTRVFELSDGYLALAIDQGGTGELNGDFGHLREWAKTGIGDSWGTDSTIEGSFGTSGDGDFTDQNYATNTSHAGQQDICQLDDGSIYIAYIANGDLTNGDYGQIKLNKRGNAQASGWSTVSTDVIGSSAEAWHVAISTDGTDVWVFYVKDSSGTRDTAIYYRKYDVSANSFGAETKVSDMQASHEFVRMATQWRADNGEIVISWTEYDTSTYDLFADSITTANSYSLAADSGSYSVTGTEATLAFNRALTSASGSYSLTGTDVNFLRGLNLAAETGSYVLTGTSATLTYTPASGATYTLNGNSGAYLISGTSAGFVYNRALTAESGSYLYTGISASLRWSGQGVWTLVDDVTTTWTEQ